VVIESNVKVAVPVAFPVVAPAGALTPVGWILNDSCELYGTVLPLTTTVPAKALPFKT
jgi:hypothetical protein